MIKKVFNMAVYSLKVAKDYVHSLEEPTKETLQKISNAIKNGVLQGVQMVGEASFPSTKIPALAKTHS